MTRKSHVSAAGAMMLLVFLTHCEANRALAASAVAVAPSESVAPVAPGTIIEIDRSAHSPTEDLVLRGLRGTAQRPIVVRGKGPGLAVVRGRVELVDAAFVTVQRLRIEPAADGRDDRPLVRIEGDQIRVDDLEVVGGPSDGMSQNAADDFARIQNVPALLASRDVGHYPATYLEPHGGAFAVAGVAWLKWQLKGDEQARQMFVGEPCGLSADPKWKVERKNIR